MNTTTKARNRILSLALAICLLLGMTLYLPGPVEVQAADVDIGTADDMTVDTSGATLVYFGHNYMQNAWNGSDTGYADNTNAPIAWRVVFDNGDNTLTLLSDQLLAYRPYDSSNNHNSWSGSEIANYLNGTGSYSGNGFIDTSFSIKEAAAMVEHYSQVEEEGYLPTDKFTPDQTIVLPSTAEIGTYTNNDGLWGMDQSTRGVGVTWWLRSPGYYALIAALVSTDGHVNPAGDTSDYVLLTFGIRPAFRLNLSSVLFTSDASGASPKSATVGSTLSSAAKPQTGPVKLTVLDSGLSLTSGTGDAGTHAPGEMVQIAYSGATITTGLYISCVIVDGDGDVLYYGKLDDTGAAAGTVEFEIPLDIADGDYTIKLFVEECNGAKETDYASPPEEIPLTVRAPTAANLTVAAPTFSAVTLGYSQQPAAQAIIITNSGETDAEDVTVALTGANAADFLLDDTAITDDTVPGNGTNTTWTVQPEMGLGVGIHTAAITVTYTGGTSMPVNVTFTVLDETVTAYNLTVENGTGGGSYPAGAAVPIQAGNPPGGMEFDQWTGGDGGTFATATNQSTTFTMPANDATVTATYREKDSGSSGSRSSSRDRSSGGSSTPDAVTAKTQLPASAFSWDGHRTLTIDHDSITPLGLLSVRWDGGADLTRGTDYSVYQGSVIIRFSEDFIAAQKDGDHTVKVEFLNHTGETTVTVGDTGLTTETDDLFDNDTHNPNTGGYPDGVYPEVTDNPNTGDSGGIWPALLLGSLGGIVLVVRRLKPVA